MVLFNANNMETNRDLTRYYTKIQAEGELGEPSTTIFKCNVCGKGWKQFCNFKCHLRIHLNLKPYSCSLCGKGFTTISNCKHHLKTKTCLKAFRY